MINSAGVLLSPRLPLARIYLPEFLPLPLSYSLRFITPSALGKNQGEVARGRARQTKSNGETMASNIPKWTTCRVKNVTTIFEREGAGEKIDGRVICLPYKFEDILPHLKDQYLGQLRVGLSILSHCTSGERIGNKVNWIDCLKPLANAEHTEKLQSLLREKIDKSEIEKQWQLNIEVLLKMSLNLAASGQQADVGKYLGDLKKILHSVLFERLDVEVPQGHPETVPVNFLFNMQRNASGRSYITIETLRSFMREQHQYLVSRSMMTTNDAFMQEFSFIHEIWKYLDSFEGDHITFERFLTLRKEYIEDSELLRTHMLRWTREGAAESHDQLCKQLIAIERQVIGDLFK